VSEEKNGRAAINVVDRHQNSETIFD